MVHRLHAEVVHLRMDGLRQGVRARQAALDAQRRRRTRWCVRWDVAGADLREDVRQLPGADRAASERVAVTVVHAGVPSAARRDDPSSDTEAHIDSDTFGEWVP